MGAPYNFVPFSDKVSRIEQKELTSHAAMEDGLYSGEITYTMTAKSPIFVGDGSENFYKGIDGVPTIPGSTVRGLIRNNASILGFAAVGDDIDDYSLMYRAVGVRKDNPNKETYDTVLGAKTIPLGKGSISVLKNVKAGYIKKEKGKYKIIPTITGPVSSLLGEMNYYVVSERLIIENYLKNKEKGKTDDSYSFLFEKDEKGIQGRTQNRTDKHFQKNEFQSKGKTIVQYYQTKGDGGKDWNKSYRPYYEEVAYSISGDKVTGIAAPAKYNVNGKYDHKGYIVGTGYMQMKKALYVIPEMYEEGNVDTVGGNKKEIIKISESDIKAFQIDFEKKKNTLRGNQKFYSLPEEREVKPVFYIQYNGHLYFGFTPRLRLFYDKTIMDGVPVSHKNVELDMVKAIFGYSKGAGYKSRVHFMNAPLVNDKNEEVKKKAVFGEPKASSYNDYLIPENGRAVSYNNRSFKLRGIKQYWLRNALIENLGNGNEKVMSTFNVLPAGAEFSGKIRFDNLKRSELGLLLWAVRLEEGSRMNIGKGKPLGYGNIDVKIDFLSLWDNKKAYSLENLSFSPWKDSTALVDTLIDDYKKDISKKLNISDIMKDATIDTFFKMKKKSAIPDPKNIRYMGLGEYQNRTPLEDVNDVLNMGVIDGCVDPSTQRNSRPSESGSQNKSSQIEGSKMGVVVGKITNKKGDKIGFVEIDGKKIIFYENGCSDYASLKEGDSVSVTVKKNKNNDYYTARDVKKL